MNIFLRIRLQRYLKIFLLKIKIHRFIPYKQMIRFGNLCLLSSQIYKFVSYKYKFNYHERYRLYRDLNLPNEITYLEFGVFEGDSMRWFVKNHVGRFYGFDSFDGLPESWGAYEKGTMRSVVPRIENAVIVKGLFQDTLPEFLKTFSCTGQLVIHMDGDLYSSTLFVLTCMDRFIKSGDIIIFDEYMCPMDEFLAFENYKRAYRREFRLIAHRNSFYHVAFKAK